MKQRTSKDRSASRRADGRWTAAVTLEGSCDEPSRREGARGPTATRKELENGFVLPAGEQRVDQYLHEWLRDSAKPTVRETTFQGYERNVRLHVAPEIGHLPLSHLTPRDLSRLYGLLAEKGLAPKTIRLVHAMLHRALRQAVRWGLLAANPVELVDGPRVPRREFRVLELSDIRNFLKCGSEDRLYALYLVALTTGLRQGELLGLRWSDLDLDRSMLAVRQQVMRLSGDWVFSEPKTSKGRRRVSLPYIAVEALRKHHERQAEDRLSCGKWQDYDLVFPNRVGRPIEKQNLMRRSFRPLLKRAGLPQIRFHDLRHSAATLLLSEGIHPKVVQERLGHSTIAVTMDIYSHVLPTLQRAAADRLDIVLTSS